MNVDHDSEQQRPSRGGQAAKYGAKKAGKSLGKKLLILLGVKGILWILVIGLVLLVIAAAAGAVSNTAAAQPAGCGTPGAQPAVNGSAPGVTAEQNANATAIINVALGLGLGYQGALIGVLTADVESDLRNVGFGDMTGPGGSMSTSRGMYQQLSAWGSLADRMDPAKSATMFYLGGAAGQKGLTQVPGWQSMDPGVAMQAVQGSQFAGGQSPGYAQKLALATSVTQSIMGAGNTPAPATHVPCPATAADAVSVALNGPTVTIPDNPNVVAELRGHQLTTGSAGIAKGLAAGFAVLGMDYVWGGGGDGAGPNNGASRGGGALNSGGSTIGFDCSGLSAYVIVQGGFPSPGGNSGAQAQPSHAVPWEQGAPGDLIVFPGHVAVFVGLFTGAPYILEASTVGVPIHVVKLTRTDHYPTMYRFWS